MNTYQVTTEERTYNAIESVHQFIYKVRVNWEDFSAIKCVFEWTNSMGWVKVDPMYWIENYS